MIETLIWSAVVSAVVAIIVVRTSRAPRPRGETVLIEDPDGNPRVELVSELKDAWPEGVTGFRFLTKEGEHRVGLGMFENEGSLSLLDETGLLRLSVRMEEGYPHILFVKHVEPPGIGGTKRVDLGLKPDGSHALEFMNEDGHCRASFGIRNDGTVFLMLRDKAGKVIWSAP